MAYVCHQAEQSLVKRGHLDLRTECWQLLNLIRRDGAHGHEGHTLCKVAMLSMCLAGTRVLHRRGVCGWLLAFQTCIIRQNRGSSGEGFWIFLDHQMESWHLLHFKRCDCVRGREGHRRRGVGSDDPGSSILT